MPSQQPRRCALWSPADLACWRGVVLRLTACTPAQKACPLHIVNHWAASVQSQRWL